MLTATIWQNWTDESASELVALGFEKILSQVTELWEEFTIDGNGERYTEYKNRTPQDVAKQIWGEIND